MNIRPKIGNSSAWIDGFGIVLMFAWGMLTIGAIVL